MRAERFTIILPKMNNFLAEYRERYVAEFGKTMKLPAGDERAERLTIMERIRELIIQADIHFQDRKNTHLNRDLDRLEAQFNKL